MSAGHVTANVHIGDFPIPLAKESGIPRSREDIAAAIEAVAGVLSKNEPLALLRLLKKLGKHAAENS